MEDKSMLYIVAIVAIVAVVALLLLVMNKPSVQTSSADATGGAFRQAISYEWQMCHNLATRMCTAEHATAVSVISDDISCRWICGRD